MSASTHLVRFDGGILRQALTVAGADGVPRAGVSLSALRIGADLTHKAFAPATARERQLASAWVSLGEVRRWDADTLVSVLIVLIETPLVEEKHAGPLPSMSEAPSME